MDRTNAPNSTPEHLYLDKDVDGGIPGTPLMARDRNLTQEEICNFIEGAGLTLNASRTDQFLNAWKKLNAENKRDLGEIFTNLKYKAPAAWDEDNPDIYFPALCLTDIDIHKDVAAANWGDAAIAFLRGIKITLKDNMSGALSSPIVTAWAISSNVATLTFQNDADHIAFLSALLEDQVSHGSYTNFRSVTVPSTIGDITAGDYALTNVNASTRQVSFAFTAANNSGSGTFSVDFYAYRIAGNDTSARVFSARGLSLMGVNDANAYFVSGGLRRRGYFQEHAHGERVGASSSIADSNNPGVTYRAGYDSGGAQALNRSSTTQTNTVVIGGAIESPPNGTPRTAKETHSPAIALHYYLHMGAYVA